MRASIVRGWPQPRARIESSSRWPIDWPGRPWRSLEGGRSETDLPGGHKLQAPQGPSEGEPLRVEFGEGVLGVRGPNESGKSSLMQAVFFALTGSPMEGGREIGQYVGYGASRAKVSLEFEVGERRYQVARTIQRIQGSLDRGRSDARLIELGPDGSRRTVCAGTRDVNAKIREMLGNLGPEELRSTVFIIQKDRTG